MEISEIKQQLSILQVLQHYNLTPDRNKQICCPFHADDTPSCRIYLETNTFHCFGCGATGDQIEFIEKYEKCSKHEALKRAAALMEKGEGRKGERNNEQVADKKILSPCSFLPSSEILTRAFTHFARSLHAKPKKAIEYLESRKLDNTSLAIGFDAGWKFRRN